MPYTVNIAYWIERNSLIYPSALALIDDRRRITYSLLQERISRLAGALREKGIGKGDRVACILYNSNEIVELTFACARLGAIVVPLNWRLGVDELEFIFKDSTPSACVYEDAFRDAVDSLVKKVEVSWWAMVCDDPARSEYEKALQGAGAVSTHAAGTGGDDDLMIIYTSGTTGLPKGAILTHDNVFWQTINGWSLGVTPATVCLVLLPLFHVGGLNSSVTPMLHVGAAVILQKKFDAGRVLRTIVEEKVTGIVAVPSIYQFLADLPEFAGADLSTLQVLISGGAPLPYHLIELYHKRGIEFRQGYGLTEASPGVTGMGPGEFLRKAGSAGRRLLYTEIKIIDDKGAELPAGEPGEILVRGPNVMKGYWKRPEETASALEGGWLRTGDIGRLDEEGFIYIVDRKKDMIISGGENIYPAEIEKLLAGHPDVAMVAVVGKSDPKWGEVPVAVLIPRREGLTPAELTQFLEGKLARYKIPRQYIFVRELPLNASGKVIKKEVRRMLNL